MDADCLRAGGRCRKHWSNRARFEVNGSRGVSPIIATILLVAITVVLAAVLYILVVGITMTSKPTANVGLVFNKQVTCTNVAATPATFNVYEVTVASSTQTITTADFGLKIVPASSSNAIAPGTGTTTKAGLCQVFPSSGAWVAVLQNSQGNALGWFDGSPTNSGWNALGSNNLPLPLQDIASIVIIGQGSLNLGQATLSLYGLNGESVSGAASL